MQNANLATARVAPNSANAPLSAANDNIKWHRLWPENKVHLEWGRGITIKPYLERQLKDCSGEYFLESSEQGEARVVMASGKSVVERTSGNLENRNLNIEATIIDFLVEQEGDALKAAALRARQDPYGAGRQVRHGRDNETGKTIANTMVMAAQFQQTTGGGGNNATSVNARVPAEIPPVTQKSINEVLEAAQKDEKADSVLMAVAETITALANNGCHVAFKDGMVHLSLGEEEAPFAQISLGTLTDMEAWDKQAEALLGQFIEAQRVKEHARAQEHTAESVVS